jgi:thiol-disulfide isomerase/thioredoxin
MLPLLFTLLLPVDLPRYKLEPGLELNYTVKPLPGEKETGKQQPSDVHMQATVLAKNADGSFRVMNFTKMGAAPRYHYTLQVVDMADDGRVLKEYGENNGFATSIFPILQQPGKETWSHTLERDMITCTFRSMETKEGQQLLREERRGGMLGIYDAETRYDYVFNLNDGIVTQVIGERLKNESTDHVPYKHNGGSGKSIMKLDSKGLVPADKLTALREQADLLLKLKDHELTSYKKGSKGSPEEVAAIMANNENAWKEAHPKFNHPALKALADEGLKNATMYVRYVGENAKRRADMLGKEAPAWEAKDFEGHNYSSEKLRGKVVVLDFWYRGCGWCIRAMPQMNQLAGDFKNEPVAILGVNIDEDPADAKFVIRKMQLAYPTLEFAKAST